VSDLKEFEIEQYELHVQKYRVEAKDRMEALRLFLDGEATACDNGCEYLEPAEAYHRPQLLTDEEFKEALKFAVVHGDNSVDSIRKVEEV